MSFFKICAFSSVLALSVAALGGGYVYADHPSPEDIKEEMELQAKEKAEKEAAAKKAKAAKEAAAVKGAPAEWGYVSSHGAAHWGELHEDYTACMQGQAQSPVNIAAYMKKDLPDFEIAYGEFPLKVVNTGHGVAVDVPGGQKIAVEGKVYNLVSLHFHTPSEHYIDGVPYPMELHLVHKADDNSMAVVGVMLKVGQPNATVEKIWGHIPAKGESAVAEEGMTITALDLLPADGAYYTYPGSLTTPPCTEGVTWYVMQNPIEISEDQLRAFQGLYPVNARPVQPLGDRVIVGD